jgi:hypothetical protein
MASLRRRPSRVDRFQQNRIPQCLQRALPGTITDLLHLRVRGVEKRLNLVVGQCLAPGPALEVTDVDDRVPLVQDLRRRRSEPLHALRDPSIPLIGQVVAERP